MLTVLVQVLLLDIQVNHLDGILLMAHQPLVRAGNDGTMSCSEALADPMTGRWGRLLLLIPSVGSNGWARFLFG